MAPEDNYTFFIFDQTFSYISCLLFDILVNRGEHQESASQKSAQSDSNILYRSGHKIRVKRSLICKWYNSLLYYTQVWKTTGGNKVSDLRT